jgi:plasmid stabilization system protein ParE
MRLVLRRQAKADLDEAFHWYEERQTGLGRSFRSAVEATLSSIQEHPSMYPRVDSLIRRAATDRFPFGVFYRVDGDTVRVVAILHNARNPDLWKKRT